VGDRLARAALGAGPGQVLVADSTSVNLYKLASAALRARPGRRAVVVDRGDFPTVRYVLAGVAEERGLELRMAESDPLRGPDPDGLAALLDEDVALLCLSAVNYRSGAVADVAAITAAARGRGAFALWDLSHAAGAISLALDRDGVDLAVGCTYKHLNAGPGAPAFLYVRRELQETLRQPIWGWFGTERIFEMGPEYVPEGDVRRFGVGTPPVLGLVLVDEGARLVEEAGIDALASRARALTGLLAELAEERLAARGIRLASPRDPARRGAQVSLARDDAQALCAALAARGVVADFRRPDVLRLGVAPLYTSFAEVWDAVDVLAETA
jgi:kynureninase